MQPSLITLRYIFSATEGKMRSPGSGWKGSHLIMGRIITSGKKEPGGRQADNFSFLSPFSVVFLEPFWKTTVCQANLHTEGPPVLHHGPRRRRGRSRNCLLRCAALLPSASPSPLWACNFQVKTSGLQSSPCLCFPEDSAHSHDLQVGYAIEFRGSLGNGGLKCF